MRNDQLVRKWVTGCPGSFSGPDHLTCLRAAYADAGFSGTMSLSEFADALARMGHVPKPVRPGDVRLILPDKASPGVSPRSYRHA